VRPTFYSTNPDDYKIGDEVVDRISGRLGVIRAIKKDVAGSPKLEVYVKTLALMEDWEPGETSIILRDGKPFVGFLRKDPRPVITRPAVQETIAHNITPSAEELGSHSASAITRGKLRRIIRKSLKESNLLTEAGIQDTEDIRLLVTVIAENVPEDVSIAITRTQNVRISLNMHSSAEGDVPVVGLIDTIEKAKSTHQSFSSGVEGILEKLKLIHYTDLTTASGKAKLLGLMGATASEKRGAGEMRGVLSDVQTIFEELNAPIKRGHFGHLPAKAYQVNSAIQLAILKGQNDAASLLSGGKKTVNRLNVLEHLLGVNTAPELTSMVDPNDPLVANAYAEMAAEKAEKRERLQDMNSDFSYHFPARRREVERLRTILDESKEPIDIMDLSELMFHSKDRDSQWKVKGLLKDLLIRGEKREWNPDPSANLVRNLGEASQTELGFGVLRESRLAVMVGGFNAEKNLFENVIPVVAELSAQESKNSPKISAGMYLKWNPLNVVENMTKEDNPSPIDNSIKEIPLKQEVFTREFIYVGGEKRSINRIMTDLGLFETKGGNINQVSDKRIIRSAIGSLILPNYVSGKNRDNDEDVASGIILHVLQTLKSSEFKADSVSSIDNDFIKSIVFTAGKRAGGIPELRRAITGGSQLRLGGSLSEAFRNDEGEEGDPLLDRIASGKSPEEILLEKEDAKIPRETPKAIHDAMVKTLKTYNPENPIYLEVDNASVLRLIEKVGAENLEEGEVNGRRGVVIHTWRGAPGEGEERKFLIPHEGGTVTGLNFNSAGGYAKHTFEGGGDAPGRNLHGAVIEDTAIDPNIAIDMSTGISYVLGETNPITLTANNITKRIDFDVMDTTSERTNLTDLPIWKTKTGVMIGLSMEGGPREQIRRASETSAAKKFLAIDIETYGPSYGRLGSVGITESDNGRIAPLYDRAWVGWKKSRNLPESASDLTGMGADEAEIKMLSEAAEIIDTHKDLNVAIYNEDVDLGKLSVIAKQHAERLQTENPELSEKLTKAAEIFDEANKSRAVNVLFLEQAANPEGGFQALGTVAERRGVSLDQSHLHSATYDAEITSKVFNAGAEEYSRINTDEWKHLSMSDLAGEIMYGRPTRGRDAFGNIVNIDISNRMLRINNIFSMRNPRTGGVSYGLDINDVSNDTSRIVKTDDALGLSTILQNLKPSGLNEGQAISEAERIATDLFQRPLHRLYTGESGGNSAFIHEVMDWRMRYATMGRQDLLSELSTLQRNVESNVNTLSSKERLLWIQNSLISNPRIGQQYAQNINWYKNQYLKYDKPFYQRIDTALQNSEITRHEAQLLIRKRSRELYGIGGKDLETPIFPSAPKTMTKPFHEWTITPNMTNSYRIRVGDVGQTRYDIEEFALRTFRRRFESDVNKGVTELKKYGISRNEALKFLQSGRFGSNAQLKRERVASNLLRYSPGMSKMLSDAAMMPELPSGATVSEMATAIHTHVKSHAQEQLLNNPTLNMEYRGVPLWETLEERGHTNEATNLERIKSYEARLFGNLTSNKDKFLRFEENRFRNENPAFVAEALKFSSNNIPKYFMSGTWQPSIKGHTPSSFLLRNEKEGYGILASLLIKNAENEYRDSELGTQQAFLNKFQKTEIERILNWQNLDKSISGVSLGVIKPVTVGGATFDIGKAIVPTSSGYRTFEDFVRGGTADEVIEKAYANPRMSGWLQEASLRYFNAQEPPQSRVAPPPIPAGGGAPAFPEAATPKPSPGAEAVSIMNEEIRTAGSKGPSVARSALLAADTWTGVSGKARDLVGVLSGRTKLSGNTLSEEIRSVLNGKPGKVMVGVAMAAMLLSSVHPVNTKDEDRYEESEDDKTLVSKFAEIKHQRVKIRVKGRIGEELNPMHVINAIHTALDMHTVYPTERSQTLSEDKRGRETEHRRVTSRILG
jgi:DNA polymerase III epsilon subunit-like protein